MNHAVIATTVSGQRSGLQQTGVSQAKVATPANRQAYALLALGERISQTRRVRDYTQTILAGIAGVGLSTVVALEAGKPSVSMGNLFKVLDALGMLWQLDKLLAPENDEVMLQHAVAALPERSKSGRRRRN